MIHIRNILRWVKMYWNDSKLRQFESEIGSAASGIGVKVISVLRLLWQSTAPISHGRLGCHLSVAHNYLVTFLPDSLARYGFSKVEGISLLLFIDTYLTSSCSAQSLLYPILMDCAYIGAKMQWMKVAYTFFLNFIPTKFILLRFVCSL